MGIGEAAAEDQKEANESEEGELDFKGLAKDGEPQEKTGAKTIDDEPGEEEGSMCDNFEEIAEEIGRVRLQNTLSMLLTSWSMVAKLLAKHGKQQRKHPLELMD